MLLSGESIRELLTDLMKFYGVVNRIIPQYSHGHCLKISSYISKTSYRQTENVH